MPILIYVLALAIFAQGTSEFMLAGLLTDISTDLDVSPAVAGTLTSAFAAGMVVGAPLMAALGARLPARRSLVTLLLVFVSVHAVGAFAESFELLLATRVVAALANAGFLAVALGTVRRVVPIAAVTRAVSILLAGTTVATIAGVPAGAALAQALGWRSTFWGVAVLCVPAIVGLLLDRSLRSSPVAPPFDIRVELAELRRGPVLGAVVLAMLVNAGTFGVFTYLGLIGEESGLEGAAIPLLLAAFGVGSFLGVSATARWAGARERLWVIGGSVLLTVVWAVFAALSSVSWGIVVMAVVGGTVSFAVGAALIGRIVREATNAPVMGGAYATAALNMGALAGPLAAGAALAAFGPAGVLGVGAVLAFCAVVLSPFAIAGRR